MAHWIAEKSQSFYTGATCIDFRVAGKICPQKDSVPGDLLQSCWREWRVHGGVGYPCTLRWWCPRWCQGCCRLDGAGHPAWRALYVGAPHHNQEERPLHPTAPCNSVLRWQLGAGRHRRTCTGPTSLLWNRVMKGDLELRGNTLTATVGVNNEVLLFRNKLSEDSKQATRSSMGLDRCF